MLLGRNSRQFCTAVVEVCCRRILRFRRGFLTNCLNFATRTPVFSSVLLQKSVFLGNGSLFLQQSTIFVTICAKSVAKRIFVVDIPTDRFASLQIDTPQIKFSKSICRTETCAARNAGTGSQLDRLESLITCQHVVKFFAVVIDGHDGKRPKQESIKTLPMVASTRDQTTALQDRVL